MSDELKKYAIYLAIIAIALAFIMNTLKSCIPNIPGINLSNQDASKTPVVDRLGDTSNAHSDGPGLSAPRTPTPKEKTTPIPGTKGETPTSIVEIRQPVCKPWNRLKQQIIVSDKGNTYVSQVCETYYGLNLKTKFLLGYNGYTNIGVMQNFLSYDRYDVGAVVTFPSIGLGLSGYITDHSFLMAGATWNYIVYDDPKEIKSYVIGDFRPRPIIGFGFDF